MCPSQRHFQYRMLTKNGIELVLFVVWFGKVDLQVVLLPDIDGDCRLLLVEPTGSGGATREVNLREWFTCQGCKKCVYSTYIL